MTGPYRTPDAPSPEPRANGGPLIGTVLGLLLLHGIFAVAFLLLTPVLRWVGANGLLGIGMRLVGTLVTVGFAWFVLMVVLQAWSGLRGLIASGVLFVGWIALSVSLMDHAPRLYLLMPRAGAVELEPLGWFDMILAGQLNCAVAGVLAVILALKPLWTSIEAEKSRLIVANLDPCPRCGNRWELEGTLKRCVGCGDETTAPTAEEVRAIRGG
jgi:hypothetical protein